MRGRAAVAMVVAGALAGGSANAVEVRMVDGGDLATLVPPPGAQVAEYANQGYELRRNQDGTWTVQVDLAPLASRTPFRAPDAAAAASNGSVGRLAAALTAGATTRYEAVTRVLAWVADQISYDLDRRLDQSAEAVLERRSAYCTGISRLTVALLSSVEIEAREVPGYVVGAAPAGAQGGFHRWVEVHYPDRGWVFSDPVATHHFVPATYLRLAADLLESEPGAGALVDRNDRSREIDLRSWNGGNGPGVRARGNDETRRAAALVVQLRPEVAATATLEGGGRRRVLTLAEGRGSFVGLEPGSYELSIEHGGRRAAWKRVTFRNRVLAELEVPVGASPPVEVESRQ